MAAEAVFRYSDGEIKWTAGGALASGEIVTIDDGTVVVVAGSGAGFASGEEATGYTKGVFDFKSASAVTFTKGDAVYWDISGNTAIVQKTGVGDLYLGTATHSKASGALTVKTRLNPTLTGASELGVKVHEIKITADYDSSEQDTSWTLPAKCVVLDVFLDVTTADSSQTIDVGTNGSGSNDPNGFLDGASVNATGIIRGTIVTTTNNQAYLGAAATHTLGALFTGNLIAGQDTADKGDGNFTAAPDVTSGGESITYTGSDSTNTARGSIFVVYIEL